MNSSGTVTAVNCFGPDGLVSRQSGGNWTYYTFDQQGNVAVRQNSDGSISSRSTFDAYGAETATNSPSDPYAYNGQWGYYYDRETGLYYCQNRYYDPSQGRWLNRDPIGYSGGANLYGYCGGGPVGASDPSGLAAPVAAVAAVAGIALAAWDIYDVVTNPADPLNWFALIDPTPAANVVKILKRFKKGADVAEEVADSCAPVLRGRRGGADHRATVQKLENEYTSQGYKHVAGGSQPERKRGNRFPDLIFEDPNTGKEFFINVGNVYKKSGEMVSREKAAYKDLSEIAETLFAPIQRGLPYP